MSCFRRDLSEGRRGACMGAQTVAAMAVTLTLAAGARAGAPGVAYQVVHSFEGADGAHPRAALIVGSDGRLHGTASGGGESDSGTAFRMTPQGRVTRLHSFISQEGSDLRGIVQARDGNDYGVSYGGGNWSYWGTVYRVGSHGMVKVLHAFLIDGHDEDCSNPLGTLIQGADGDFYGTTYWGGRYDSWGCVFRMSAGGKITVLHSFNNDGIDGYRPQHGLAQAADGKLYGTTFDGGAFGRGIVFRLNTDGSDYEVLHAFGASDSAGEHPSSGLIDGADGGLYGVAYYGGAHGMGTAYRVSPSGEVAAVHAFANDGSDGMSPLGDLLLARDGYFYGVTSIGGKHALGTVYQMARDGSTRMMHPFNGNAPFAHSPDTGLVETADGEFFGTTSAGGEHNLGAVYRLRFK